jgi:hypothetical protein
MKNCELNVRTIDEGGIDEKSGMNFSEYIAILSGDTTLLEKSKLEKKIAVLESLKRVHYKEVARSRNHLDNLRSDRDSAVNILDKLSKDKVAYTSVLKFDKDGTKLNAIKLIGLESADPEVIGKFIISIYNNWKPEHDPKIGNLYGFDLYVRQHTEFFEMDRQWSERKFNTFYAERAETGIKYTYNQGHPNVDNTKLAARHFISAINRVTDLAENEKNKLAELEKEIPMVELIMEKPFEKEAELAKMKTELATIEREIALNIQEKQMKEPELYPAEGIPGEEPAQKETLILKIGPNTKHPDYSLKPVVFANGRTNENIKKVKGIRL